MKTTDQEAFLAAVEKTCGESTYPWKAEYFGRRFASTGMTKREFIATQAMAALIACPHLTCTPQSAALTAVDYADALLAALEKEPTA